jgi:hypothetical protein
MPEKAVTTYRVTASTGGRDWWRSLPWPFGRFDVRDDGLLVHSLLWSWWVADRWVARDKVESIRARWTFFSVARLAIATSETTRPIRVQLSVVPAMKLVSDLRKRGYLVTEIGKPRRLWTLR